MYKIFIIDDSLEYRTLVRAWLKGEFEVTEFATTDGALEKIRGESPACILLDANLPKEDGFVFLHRLSKTVENMPMIIFISGFLDEALRRNVLALGASECVEKKDIDKDKLISMINRLLGKKAA
jgi:CheY-like chemotaxis protein